VAMDSKTQSSHGSTRIFSNFKVRREFRRLTRMQLLSFDP
jgi:hypothetical protein